MPADAERRYGAWLSYVFDRPTHDPAWYFDLELPEFEASSEVLVDLLTHTFRRCGADLARFTDGQVNDGLNYIFGNACSNVAFALMDGKVAPEKRKAALAAIKQLYADCFERRCAPVLGHRDEPGATPLNQICYMLWDITPLGWWEGSKEKEIFYPEVLAVLRYALGSRNIACIESALHGLGHLRPYRAAEVAPIIQDFMRGKRELRPELRTYAENAAAGCIL